MAKLSEQKKVELLETAVANNDVNAVNSLFAEHRAFEFTARALGRACRTGDENLVRALCENGASFYYEATPAMVKKYDCKIYVNNYDSILRDYSQMIIVGMPEKNSMPEPAASGMQRKKNLAVLWEYRDAVGLDGQELLYWVLLWQDEEIVSALKELGVTTLSAYRADLAAGRLPHNRLDAVGRYDRKQFSDALQRTSEQIGALITDFYSILGGCTIHLFKSDIVEYSVSKDTDILRPQLCGREAFHVLSRYTNFLELVKKQEVLYTLVDQGNAEGLAYVTELGWVSDKDRKNLLKYTQTQDPIPSEVMALLLEQTKQETAAESTMSLAAPTTAELKAAWSSKKLDNGDLIITGYKGDALDVVIPERIGKAVVMQIASDAFDPRALRINSIQAQVRNNIRSVVIPGTVSVIPHNLFSDHRQNLRQVVISEGVTAIGRNAFYNCTALEEIILPQTLTTIESGAFGGCENLTAMSIPDTVETIGDSAFYRCEKMTNDEGFFIFKDILYHYSGNEKEVLVSDSVKGIGAWSMSYGGAQSVILPDGIAAIGEGAFYGCKDLRTVRIPESVDSIGPWAFMQCGNLTSIVIPEGVTTVADAMFYKCQNLNAVTLPDSVRSIGRNAFLECRKLTIHAPAGSFAETYAKEMGIPFVAE